jgi:flavin-dependent dehydrogenase
MPPILIAGAGIAGSYLYRLLVRRGIDPGEIEVVDPGPRTHCGIAPCCFATTKQFYSLCEDVGLEPEDYILRSIDSGYVGSFRVKIQGHAFVIDKPALIKDLLSGAGVSPQAKIDTEPARIVDATGGARAYIGKYDQDVLIRCFQRKVEFPDVPVAKEFLHHVGVSWVIPLESGNAHVGTASHTYDLRKMKEINEVLAEGGKPTCGCQGYIRGRSNTSPGSREGLGCWRGGRHCRSTYCVGDCSGNGIGPASCG